MVFPHGSNNTPRVAKCAAEPEGAATGLSASLARALSAHIYVELAENGVIHCLPWEALRSTIDTKNKKEMIAL